MSKMKKVISLVLCIVMLAGTFTFLGDLIVPSAKAAGTTNVTPYATIDAAYDKFVYVGIDVVEVANGELTDGFVQPGDWLEYRATILSDMYIGNSNPHLVYEKDFFDVRVITSTTPSTSETFNATDYEGNKKKADGSFMNPDHPVHPSNGTVQSYNTLTAFPSSKVTTQLGFCEIDATVYENWDLVKSNLGVTTTVTNTNFEMKTDEWITSWYVRVKEGLAEGDTGKSFSPKAIWKLNINTQTGQGGDSRRLADIYTGDSLGTYGSSIAMNLRYNNIDHLLLDDCEHTFTIGKGAIATFMVDGKAYGDPVKALTGTDINAPEAPTKDGYEFKGWALKGTTDILTFPQTMGETNVTYVAIFEAAGGEDPVEPEVIKYTISFVKYDGTEISTDEYEENTEVAVPDDENIVAWLLNGKTVELGETVTATEDITYTAIYNTDKFDVKIILGGGTYAEDVVLPEGAYVEGDNLIVKAGLGAEVDLTALPLPEKEGYTASWAAETVKVESIKGANVRITWTIDTYEATFYLDKEAYDAGADALKTIDFRYGTDMTAAFNQANVGLAALKPEKKFVGWKNAATGEAVSNTAKFADDVAFYADWTDFDATVTVWGRDYENGGWKALTTKYADVGTTVKLNDLKALVTEANYGTAAAQYVVAGSASTFSNDTAIRADFAMVAGNTDVYLFTNTKFETTFKTPVFDEDGFITDEYTSTTKSSTSSTDDTFLKATVLAETPAAYTGYKFVGWADAEGNVYAPGNIALDYANGTTAEFTAEYELVEYTIQFAVDNKSAIKELLTVNRTFKLGDVFTLAEETVVKEDGTEGTLPEIGVENAEQAGGPYRNVDGYEFTGWKVGTQAANLVDYDITNEVTLTPEIIKTVTLNETIQIKGFWEALSYDFVAYIAKSYDAEGKPVYEALPAVSVLTGASLADVYAAAAETAKENLPNGYRFSLWKLEDDSNTPNTMPAYGVKVYATYAPVSLSVYIDYNFSTEEAPVALEETMKKNNQFGKNLFYGVDVVNYIPENEQLSIDMNIRTSTITEATRPGEKYEVVDWTVYYVTDEADVYDKTKWNEGYNEDANSTIAKYTLIYQVKWMAHKDFFFRVYNTNGELRSALGKKFEKYFWYNNKPATKETAVPLNALPDRLIILGFLPTFEFEGGFAISVKPLTLSKAWLDPTNWGSLLEALFNGLSTGFGGAI